MTHQESSIKKPITDFELGRVRLRFSGKQLYPGFSYRLQLNLAESEADNDQLSNILWDADRL